MYSVDLHSCIYFMKLHVFLILGAHKKYKVHETHMGGETSRASQVLAGPLFTSH